nr:hypothetical protein [Tanacetum cinerariifolium]
MSLLFADTHNVVAILEKSDVAEGFKQIIDFLNGDVTRLQALVDKKRIVITEEVVREILQLNDADGVICLPNEEIFSGLALMGYEKQRFLLICEGLGKGDNVQEPADEEVVPPTLTPQSPPSPVIPFSLPHQPPCPPPQPQDAEGSSLLFQQVLDTCSALALRVEGLENDKAAHQLEIVKLKARVKKLEKINKGRIIVDMDQDEGIELVTDQEKDAEVEGRHADKQAEIYNIDLDYSSKVLSKQEDDTKVAAGSIPIPAAKPKTLTITAAPAKKDQIEMDAGYARKLQEEINKEHEETYKNIDWNATLDHVQSKEPQYIKRYYGIKKKPQIESEARKNMIFYLKNTKVKDNKPKYKIIIADDTHQFYISFTTLLKNFDREDLETLWRIGRNRFSTSKPTNFSDEYLLLTLKTMFEELDGQDAI